MKRSERLVFSHLLGIGANADSVLLLVSMSSPFGTENIFHKFALENRNRIKPVCCITALHVWTHCTMEGYGGRWRDGGNSAGDTRMSPHRRQFAQRPLGRHAVAIM
jgi:hypothetical protein